MSQNNRKAHFWEIFTMIDYNLLGKDIKRIFFCGIGGASMLGLAVFLKKNGFSVQGSDNSPREETVTTCRENGIALYFSHDAENVVGCEAFVYTAAIAGDNPELANAIRLGLTLLTRSKLLGIITSAFENSIGISGTHGKSTVTNMLYSVFSAHGKLPTLFAGAAAVNTNASMISGSDNTVIYEACEYNRSFLDMPPTSAVILNVEREHTDIYPELSDAEDAFFQFASKSKSAILSADSPSCKKLTKRLNAAGVATYNFSLDRTHSALFAENLRSENGFFTFDAVLDGKPFVTDIRLSIPGLHSVSNALAAILCATVNGVDNTDNIKVGIKSFRGIKRRLEYIGTLNGADVYDDYAHHPTEIRATLDAVRQLGYKKIICAFQPHTYSRTKEFFHDFAKAFDGCDEVIVADIYAAREKNVYGISSNMLAKKIKNGKHLCTFTEIYEHLRLSAHPKTLILTMGAGELDTIARRLCDNKE